MREWDKSSTGKQCYDEKVQSVADTEGNLSLPLVNNTRAGQARRVIPETVIQISIIYHFRKRLGPRFSTLDSSHVTDSPDQTVYYSDYSLNLLISSLYI